ncbi:MAG: hypothetical protein DHS20C16_30290 [Phycisphaerae bacterium]|nr:MAG: hypothetical protein DHS20C16_30290 [Phycisphaerae bacterium]
MSALDLKTLPPIYAELARSKNFAADAALVEGLAHMEPTFQAHALSVLLYRGHDSALAQVVALYSKAEPALRLLLIENAELLAGGIRVGTSHALFETRRAAIELIRDSQHGKSAYLLSDALKQPCNHTASLAADVLLGLASSVAAEATTWASSTKPAPYGQLEYVASAVSRALSSWSLHFRSEVVMAAILLASPLEDVLFKMADDARAPVARALNNAVAGAQDARLVGYCVRALRCPPLREAAARCLAKMSSAAAEVELAEQGWLLLDPEVRKACSKMVAAPGLGEQQSEFRVRRPRHKRAMVRMLAASGGKPGSKVERLGELAMNGDPTTMRKAFWTLVNSAHEKSNDVLQAIAARGRGSYASIAMMELRRRMGRRLAHSGVAVGDVSINSASPGDCVADVFEPFWMECDLLEPDRRREVAQALAAGVPEFDDYLRSKWGLGDVDSQIRVLKIVEDVERIDAFRDEIQQAAESQSAVLRSLAVRMLAGLGDAKSVRLIRRALEDEDSRVQANAVESFAKCSRAQGSQKDAAVQLRQMTDAKSNRVRANAIMALLQMRVRDGAESLIKMLNSPSSGHRTSALWVVEHLNLALMMERLMKLAESDPDVRVQRRAKRIAEKFNLDGRQSVVDGPTKNAKKQGVAH